jgi:hypothetical protein
MSSLFFFRQDKGYTEEEMLKRIKRHNFNVENPVISSYANEAGISDEEIGDAGKWDTVTLFRSELEENRFKEFVEELFEDHGESGDTFNVKVWDVTDSQLDSDSLIQKGENLTGEFLPDTDDSRSYDKTIYLRKAESRDEGVVDFRFEKAGKQEDMTDEIGFETSNGEILSFSELIHSYENVIDSSSVDELDVNPEDVERAVREDKQTVEARIFPTEGLAVMSNSGVTKGLHKEILNIIREWGDGDE